MPSKTRPKTKTVAEGRASRAVPDAVVGRPGDYRPEYCEQIIELGKLGKSVVQMGCAFGVVRTTLANWAKEHPEFLEALGLARALSQDWWERTGQENLAGGMLNAGLWSRSMAARFPDDYTEKTKTELTGANGGGLEVRVAAMTPEERRAEIQRLLTQHPALTQPTLTHE
jgi:transposase